MADIEIGPSPSPSPALGFLGSRRSAMLLAYQSLGVVYGDLSVSPIYVYKHTFSGKLRSHEDDGEVLGVLSLVLWSLTLIPLCKYIVFVLAADDDGEGGTFALYSLMCRNSRIGVLDHPRHVPERRPPEKRAGAGEEAAAGSVIRSFFESHRSSRVVLFAVVLVGTSMVVGDGVLTPTMSVLAAVSGIKIKAPYLHENFTVLVACMILVCLFALQHYGTHRVGFLFAPVLLAWLCCISGVGVFNIIRWNPGVVCAASPYYAINLFVTSGRDGWGALRGVVLCITGAEAMFADLGHFSRISIRMAFVIAVYPCLVLAYMGEAAYLTKHKEDLGHSFYKSIPENIFWPVFLVGTLAVVVASQAIISATFSVVSQCRALGCFPRVKIIHTSSIVHGQIYIPEINWLLMLLCLGVAIGFGDTDAIGNAYGLTVTVVMFVTTLLMFLIITIVWRRAVALAILFAFTFGALELLYFSACLEKVHRGGWLSLALSLIILLVISAWRYGTSKKRSFELQNKVCVDQLLSFGREFGLARVPGVSLVYTGLATGVPLMFGHFVANYPAVHRVCIFVSLQTVAVPRVRLEDRYLVERVGPPEHRLYRCVVRFGYKDIRLESFEFENQLIAEVSEFLKKKQGAESASDSTTAEARELLTERESGVAYMMGHTSVVAREPSPLIKKIAIDGVYSFLRRNSRRPAMALGVPHSSLVQVGMLYQV